MCEASWLMDMSDQELRDLHTDLYVANTDGRHDDQCDAILEELRFRSSAVVEDTFQGVLELRFFRPTVH